MTKHQLSNLTMAGFLIGALLGSLSLRQPSLFLLVLVPVAMLLAWHFQPARPALLCLVGLLVGYLYTEHWRLSRIVHYPYGQSLSIVGTVSQPPDIRHDKILLTVQPNAPNLGGQILVSTARYPVYHYGDVVQFKGAIEQPKAFNGFDYPLYLERLEIYGTLRRPQKLQRIRSERSLLGQLYQLREHLEQVSSQNLPEPESSFLSGILLGSKRAIPDDVQADLQTTGTTHIIAISGANITIAVGLLIQLLPLRNRWQQFWVTFSISILLTVMSGAPASVLRGSATVCLMSLVKACSRRPWATPLLLCGGTVLLLGNPLLLVADPGFQLSFGAFAGLLYFGPLVQTWIRNWPLPEAARGSAIETIAASLGTLPFSFYTFGQLPLLGFMVNPLVLWLLEPITLLGFSLLCFPFLGPLLKLPLWFLLHTVLAIIQWFGRLGIGVLHWKSSGWVVISFYIVLALLTSLCLKKYGSSP